MKEKGIEDFRDHANHVSIFGHTLMHGTVETLVDDIDHYKLIARINQLAVGARSASASPRPRRKLHSQFGLECAETIEVHTITDICSVFESANVTQNINHSVTNSDEKSCISDIILEESSNTDIEYQSEHDHNCTENVKVDATSAIDGNTVTAYTDLVDLSECSEDECLTRSATETVSATTLKDANNTEVVNSNVIVTENRLIVNDGTFSDVNEKEYNGIVTAVGSEETYYTECLHSIRCHENVWSNDDEYIISSTDDDGIETESTNNESMSFLDISGGYVRCRIRSPFEQGRYDSIYTCLGSEPEFLTVQEGRVVCMIKRLKRDHSSWMDDDTDSENEYKIDRLFRSRKSDRGMDLDTDTESDTASGSVSTNVSDVCDVISDVTEDDEHGFTVTGQCNNGDTNMTCIGDEVNEETGDTGSFDTLMEVELDYL